jgi:hypothetical protein
VLIIGRPMDVVSTPLGAKHVLVEGAYIRSVE